MEFNKLNAINGHEATKAIINKSESCLPFQNMNPHFNHFRGINNNSTHSHYYEGT